MRPGRDPVAPLMLTRRALARCLAAGTAAIGMGARQIAAAPVADPALRDATLRGLALADHRGDPVHASAARAAIARLTETDPEGALLFRLYRRLDVRPAAYWSGDMAQTDADEDDLALLHRAIGDCTPLRFGYTDLGGNETTRMVLPLALVHPPQGVKLLAWCKERQDFRQFFVRAMSHLTPQPGDFRADRMTLLEGLAEKEGA